MQRIPSLLQKLTAIQKSPQPKSVLDLDLMLDYTRVLYADLLEWRNHLQQQPLNLPQPGEPTLDELTAMMEEKLRTAGDGDGSGAEAPLSSMARKLDIAVPFRRPSSPPVPAPQEPAPQARPTTEKASPAPQPPAEAAPPPVQKEAVSKPELPVTAPVAPSQPAPPPLPPLAPLPLVEKPDLRHRIGINDKYQFISELFGNDPAGYESALTALSRLESLREAERWMRENLLLSERAEDSDALESFRGILEDFYKR